jgi:hypothetical protein
MTIATFRIPFDGALPTAPDADGKDQIINAGRVGLAGHLSENIVAVEAPAAVITELKSRPGYTWLENVGTATTLAAKTRVQAAMAACGIESEQQYAQVGSKVFAVAEAVEEVVKEPKEDGAVTRSK